MNEEQIREKVEEATLDFSLGKDDLAAEKLQQLLGEAPGCYDGWLALTEVQLARRDLEAALEAAEKALALAPEDIHVHTSLSRIWVEKGDKERRIEKATASYKLTFQEVPCFHPSRFDPHSHFPPLTNPHISTK